MLPWLLFPALAMSLGWGLRGYIGGGPLGAMIPGAMVGIALCLLLRKDAATTAVVAALAAVGVGFGGQMTYGNTIQLAIAQETRAWGLLGLTVKGAVWGLLGGGVIGLALERGRISLAGLAAMVAGTGAGWWFFNVPRLIYFSIDRAEVWAGMLVGALAMLAVERSLTAWRFALVAMLGGGVGFGFGGWLQVWGRWNAPHPWVGWWKVMEFFFGWCFGLALGWSSWRWRSPSVELDQKDDGANRFLAMLLIAGALYATYNWEFRFGYTIIGAVLIAMVAWWPVTGVLVALLMTMAAFFYDVSRNWMVMPIVTALSSARSGIINTPLRMFLVLMWSANALATIKAVRANHFVGEHALFLVFGVILTWLARRITPSPTR